MSTEINSIGELFEKEIDVSIPIYLDAASLRQFAVWAREWGDLLKRLVKSIREDGLQLIVFDAQLQNVYRRSKYKKAIDQLRVMEADLDNESWEDDDDVFASELKSIYFHDEISPLCDLHARFLVLARHASTSHPLRIVTAYPSFHRVINTEIFMLPDTSSEINLPGNLDLFTDIGIHEQLRRTVSVKFLQQDYVGAVQDAVQELFAYLQSIDPNTSGYDGWRLVNEVLGYKDVSRPKNQNLPEIPRVKLTQFLSDTEKNDHKGYYHFIGGAYSAFRNIGAHHAPSSQERRERFDDKRKAIKIICFLSLLFEKIDQRINL